MWVIGVPKILRWKGVHTFFVIYGCVVGWGEGLGVSSFFMTILMITEFKSEPLFQLYQSIKALLSLVTEQKYLSVHTEQEY